MSEHRKRAPVIAMIAALGGALVATPATAVDDLSLNVVAGSETVMPGETVIVTLDVADLSVAINGVQALIHYDDTVLTLVDIVPVDLGLLPPAEGWVEVNESDDFGDVTYAVILNGGATIVDGIVATLTFTAIDEGVTSITFRPDADPFFTKLTVAADNTTIFPITTDSATITSTCDDGLYCNGLETFVSDSCQAGTPPDCSTLTDQCNDGVCNEDIDACEAQPVNEGGDCDDDDLCTETDVCTAGVCAGTDVDCSHLDDACNVGTCNPADGSCEAVPTNEGGSCDNGEFCDGTETCSSGVCISSGDPCAPLLCDEVNDECFASIHVADLEVFYAGRFGTCVGGDNEGLYCSSDGACRNSTCDVSAPLADPGPKFLATGSTATINNLTNYVRGITGIRVFFNDVVDLPTPPDAAFGFEWSDPPVCVGGSNDGQPCNPDNPNDQCILGGGTCEVLFFPVTDAATAITVTPTLQGDVTVVTIVLDDYHVRRRWLMVTIDSTQVIASGVELDGEMVGNPVVLPSGDNIPGGDAVFYLGNTPGDVDDDRKTTLTDLGLIRSCPCFNPFFRVPITEWYDVDKDVWVRLADLGAARVEVNPFFKLPLISP